MVNVTTLKSNIKVTRCTRDVLVVFRLNACCLNVTVGSIARRCTIASSKHSDSRGTHCDIHTLV